MRPSLPTANRGPGFIPHPVNTVTLRGVEEHVATVVGSSGRAASIRARTVTINQQEAGTHALVIQSAGTSFTGNLLVLKDVAGNTLLTINNSGTVFAGVGIQVLTVGDAEEMIRLDSSDGSIYMGDGVHTPEEVIGYQYDSLT